MRSVLPLLQTFKMGPADNNSGYDRCMQASRAGTTHYIYQVSKDIIVLETENTVSSCLRANMMWFVSRPLCVRTT